MSFWRDYDEPCRCDYDTEEEYEDAMHAYRQAEFFAEQDAIEDLYEREYGE